jgi:CheY-like chemotaxis protein
MTADSRPTVLIVEDDTSLQSVLEALLGRDYRVTIVGDGKEALEHLQWDTPNLVILDVTIPHVDGLDICSRIKRIKRFRDTRVIVMTASMDERTHDAANLAKADAFVSKPIANEQFRQLVREMINKSDAPKSFTDAAFTGSLADASADRTPPPRSNEAKITLPPSERPVSNPSTVQPTAGIIKAEFDSANESEFVARAVPQAMPVVSGVDLFDAPQNTAASNSSENTVEIKFEDWDDLSQEDANAGKNVTKDDSANF